MSDGNGQGNGLHVGTRMRRKEDPPLIQGRGHFVDDITLQGVLYAAFVRSPEAHARIVSIDTEAALQHPKVHAVITGEDLEAQGLAWMPTLNPSRAANSRRVLATPDAPSRSDMRASRKRRKTGG